MATSMTITCLGVMTDLRCMGCMRGAGTVTYVCMYICAYIKDLVASWVEWTLQGRDKTVRRR